MACCCIAAGNVACSWGRGEDGQLGHGDAEDRLLPTLITALDGHEILSITCGADHTTAYSESLMQVYSWGWYISVPENIFISHTHNGFFPPFDLHRGKCRFPTDTPPYFNILNSILLHIITHLYVKI